MSFVILLTQIWTISYIFIPLLSHKVSVPALFRNHIHSIQCLFLGVRMQLSLLHTRLFKICNCMYFPLKLFNHCHFCRCRRTIDFEIMLWLFNSLMFSYIHMPADIALVWLKSCMICVSKSCWQLGTSVFCDGVLWWLKEQWCKHIEHLNAPICTQYCPLSSCLSFDMLVAVIFNF